MPSGAPYLTLAVCDLSVMKSSTSVPGLQEKKVGSEHFKL